MVSISLIFVPIIYCFYFDVAHVQGDFEDSRCRCVCPGTIHFAKSNATEVGVDRRRYYTQTNINSGNCNAQHVVLENDNVRKVIDEQKMDAFLANCDCRFETRNTIMLKFFSVVVIFVICVVLVLITYMLFLLCLDPMIARQRTNIRYQHHIDDLDDNVFAPSAIDDSLPDRVAFSTDISLDGHIRTRNAGASVLDKVEAQQNKWMRKVEEQRKNIFTNHTMLN